MFPGTTFSCAYSSAGRQEKCLRSISEAIRCSRRALRSDLGAAKSKRKSMLCQKDRRQYSPSVSAHEQQRNAAVAPCVSRPDTCRRACVYVCMQKYMCSNDEASRETGGNWSRFLNEVDKQQQQLCSSQRCSFHSLVSLILTWF